MSKLTAKQRQQIVHEYLKQSGANQYVPSEFLDWLSEHPEHPAYGWFEWDDGAAADAHRLEQARAFVRDLRISFSIETVGSGGKVRVSAGVMPAMISPIEGRLSGGGYVLLQVDDSPSMDMYCDEAARALESWCRRYTSAVLYRGGNIDALRKIIAALAPPKEPPA